MYAPARHAARVSHIWIMKRRKGRRGLSRRRLAYAVLLLGHLRIAAAELPVPCASGCVQAGGPGAWISAGSVQAPVVAGSRMTIQQSSGNASLNWQTFNIGNGYSVEFKQPSAGSVAINRVWDPSGNPTQILGSLKANGQIYLVNRNGILFGEGARVDTASLVASSLELTPAALSRGLIRAFSDGSDRQPAFAAAVDADGNLVNGDVLIASGAVLRARDGGQILVFAPNVLNEGTIETPNGQTVLGAGNKIYLISSSDSDLRGLVVEVDVDGVSDEQLQGFLKGELAELPLGRVANYGSIDVANGNATLVGLAVNQSGRVSATTSVRANGTVFLRAADRQNPSELSNGLLRPTRGGKVELGAGSVTEVLPDYADTGTTVDINAQPLSTVTATGHTVHLGEGARITAIGGEVALTAQADPSISENALAGTAANDSRIFLAKDSVIDVSGAAVELPADRLLLEVELRAEELKDSPLQREGVLRGKKVTVDLRKRGVREDGTTWVGTPLADLSGAVAAVERSVGERSTTAGTVRMTSQGDVIVAPDALIDVSGGRIDYAAGQLRTTLVASNGRLYDISEADPSLAYDAIIGQYSRSSAKWGITRTWQFPGVAPSTYSAPFSEGRDAGSVVFNTPRLILDGAIAGSVVNGLYQRGPGNTPRSAQLVVGYEGGGDLEPINYRIGAIDFREELLLNDLFAVGFDPSKDEFPLAFEGAVLRPSLFSAAGVGHGVVLSNGAITLGEDVALSLPAGGSLTLSATTIEIAGSVIAPGGTIEAEAVRTVSSQLGDQSVGLRSGALLDVGGLWVNDGPMAGGPDATPVWIDGGAVVLSSVSGEVVLEDGARIDASGGAWRQWNGRIEAGAGGDIALAAGNGGVVRLDAQLGAEALSRGGNLSLTTNALCIGAEACVTEADAGAGTAPLVLAPEFFRSGGFGSYQLSTTLGDLVVAGDADLRPVQMNRVLDASHAGQPTGADLEAFSRLELLPDHLRRATSVSLRATGAHPSELRIEQGAGITADPGASIGLSASSRMWVDGALTAPGGAITLNLQRHPSADLYAANDVIWLGPEAVLDVSGVTRLQPDAMGLRTGEVMDGGTVSLRAQRGYVVAEAGSLIDVSGTSATLDLPSAAGRHAARAVNSNAGTIRIAAAEGAILDGTLLGRAGGANALGGTLSLTIDGNTRGEPINQNNSFPDSSNNYPHAPRVIEVVGDEAAGDGLAGFTYETMGDAFTQAYNGVARLRTPSLAQGGFDALELTARHLLTNDGSAAPSEQVRSPGSVSVGADLRLGRSLVIDAPTISAAAPEVTLSAPYVALGSTDALTQAVPGPTAAGRTLTVDAGWLDLLGSSAVSGADRVYLRSASDLRLRSLPVLDFPVRELLGSLTGAGDLEIEAARIYPATLTDFTLTALDTAAGAGSITVRSGGDAAGPVLSAGGTVRLHASRIENQGVIKAPLGVIDLRAGSGGGDDGELILAPGSLLSTSGEGQVIPFGRTEGGLDWIYDLGNRQKLVFGVDLDVLPVQEIRLSGARLDLQEGSRLDVSAGGDLQAYEFVPGVGGSRDVLALDQAARSFAVLPAFGETVAPFDQQESAGFSPKIGTTVHLEGVDGLPAGEYVLLPARYALLPGAYLLTERPGFEDLQPGLGLRLPGGLSLVSGSYGVTGTDQRESRARGFVVQSSALLRDAAAGNRPAEYTLSLATQFFADGSSGVRLPLDAGTVALSALEALDLRASLEAAVLEGGRGAALDIAAPDILITAGAETATEAGTVPISAAALNGLGAESILLGGRRSQTAGGTRLEVVSDDVTLAEGAMLELPELLLAANERIVLESGARLVGRGDASSADGTFVLDGDGALMRVSGAGFVDVERRNAAGAKGVIEVAEDASVEAVGAAVIDAAANIAFRGELQVGGASLLVGAPRINLGDAPAGAQGFTIDAETLGGLGAGELQLRGRQGIDLYGALQLNAESLVLDTPTLTGYDNGDALTRIEARQIVLTNTAGTAGAGSPAGDGGRFEVAADDIRLGRGRYAIAGFGDVALTADRTLLGRGEGHLEVLGGSLELAAGAIGGERGAATRIAVDGNVAITGGDESVALDDTAIGASLRIDAAGIHHAGRIVAPAGVVSLGASGPDGVMVANGAVIEAGGVMRQFDTVQAFAPAGTIALSATTGDVVIEEGAVVTVAGAAGAEGAGGDAGQIAMDAPGGAIRIEADIGGAAVAGQRQGRIALDGAAIADLDALNARLNLSGFTDERVLRVRTGDVALGGDITANRIDITVDGGALLVGGMLDAAGHEGGHVRLAARDDISLAAGAAIDASAAGPGEDGGKVELMSAVGGVKVLAGSAIAAVGGGPAEDGAAGEGGSVLVRVDRAVLADLIGTANGNGMVFDGAIDAGEVVVEGVKVYDLGPGDAVIDASLAAAFSSEAYTDAAAFMQDSGLITAALGRAGDGSFHVRPGVEMRAGGNLTLAAPWDLYDWRFDGEPGYLTLRAGGDLNIDRNLSDGVSAGFFRFMDQPVQDSWSYRLAAGADLHGASPFAVRRDAAAGDLRLAANTHIRAGTGDIEIAAAGDIRLANDGSVIYTTGVPVSDISAGLIGFITFESLQNAALAEGGGDITLSAGGSIVGVPGNQLVTDWLWRLGSEPGFDFPSPTMWGIEFSQFRQGVGALAGGDVSLRAGRDIDNVSAVIPTVGAPLGATQFDDNEIDIRGGGHLRVEAGGDIGGGVYYVGKGLGELRAGGSIRAGTGWNFVGTPLHTTLALGDGEFSLIARRDLALETVFNPTLLAPGQPQISSTPFTLWLTDFSTYSADSGVRLMAVSGDVALHGNVDFLRRASSLPSNLRNSNQINQALTVYPPSLRVSALAGDIVNGPDVDVVRQWISLAPAAQGQAEFLAYGDVRFRMNGLLLSGGDPALFPSPEAPQLPSVDQGLFSWFQLFRTFGPFTYADVPVHSLAYAEASGYEGPRVPVMIVARTGDVDMSRWQAASGTPAVMSAKPVKVIAGGDVLDPSLAILHPEASDVSLISAGGDISYTVSRGAGRQIVEQNAEISVDGPGDLLVLAGGGIDLKASPGIVTRGNTVAPTLADAGANITVMTGIEQTPDYEAFITRYLEEGDAHAQTLAAYLSAQGVPASEQPLEAFRALPRERQIPFLTQVLFAELRASGRKAATEGSADFEGGYAALETLFPAIYPDLDPDTDPRGDLSLFFSRIYTLDGGDVNVVAPGGVVNVGLSTPPDSFGVAKSASQLGIVAQRSGSVNVLSGSDTLVNQSRVFAADGGSILMWSSAGDIDAGRGAKSAISAPPAVITYDPNTGQATVEFPPALTGSGIRAFVTTAGRAPGDVDLYAPVGVINAGDAGIGSAGNVTVAATEVIGADNIDIGGIGVGVPVADTGSLAAGLTGVSNVSGAASKSSEESLGGAGSADKTGDTPLADAAFAVLDVVVLGLGEGVGRPADAAEEATQGEAVPAARDCGDGARCGDAGS